MISFWSRIILGNQNKLSYRLYKLIRIMHCNENNEFRSPWIEYVSETLNCTGLNNLWLNEGDGFSTSYIINAFKLKTSDAYSQNWHSTVEQNTQCNIYRMYKETCKLETYITSLGFKDRIAMTRFRCRNHQLPISKRLNNENDDTTCKLCQVGDTGDEFHYLLVCPYFNETRKRYLGVGSYSNPNIFTIKVLLQTNNVVKMRNVARFMDTITVEFQIGSYLLMLYSPIR